MILAWSNFKSVVSSKSLALQWYEDNSNYYLSAFDGPNKIECTLDKTPSDTAELDDFEGNFKASSNQPIWQTDIDGAQIVRLKAAKKGWTYAAIPIEFKTAEIGSLYSKNLDGTNRGGISLRFYDSNGNAITEEGLLEVNEATIIRSVVDFEPTYDYEIIGGELRIEQDISSPENCRLYIIAVPDIPAAYGGSKEMAGGINLRYLAPQNVMSVDGRVAKTLLYNQSLHTNKIRIIFEHTAGLGIWIHITLELYRA